MMIKIKKLFFFSSLLLSSSLIQAADYLDEQEALDLERAIRISYAEHHGYHCEETEQPPTLKEREAYDKATDTFLYQYAASHIKSLWSSRVYQETSPEIVDIFLKPDYQKWQSILSSLTDKPSTALEIVFLLDQLHDTATFGATHFRHKLEKQISQTISFLAQQAILQIVAGCWGFSSTPLSNILESKLKNVLHSVGQAYKQFENHPNSFSQDVFNLFVKSEYFKKPSLQQHFFTVFNCLCEGYTAHEEYLRDHIMEEGRKNFISQGYDKHLVNRGMNLAGYYSLGHSITLKDLLETAHYRNSSFYMSRQEQQKIEQALEQKIDFIKPENVNNFRIFLKILAEQPLINIADKKNVKTKLIDKLEFLRNRNEKDKQILSSFVFDSLKNKKLIWNE